MKKFLKVIGILIALLIVIAIATSCGSKNDTSEAAKDAAPVSTEAPAPAMTKDEFKAIVDLTMEQNFANYNYNTSWNGDTLVMNTWGDGIAEGAIYAVMGNAECVEAWGNLVDNSTSLCKTTYDSAIEHGLNVHVEYNILNNTNTDNVLLSIKDGAVTYNVVTD